MLPRRRHLLRGEIAQIIKQGRRQNGRFYRVSGLKLVAGSESKFTFVVSAKAARRAVDRNRLKRQGRHIVVKNLKSIAPGWGLVVFISPQAHKTPFPELEADLLNILPK